MFIQTISNPGLGGMSSLGLLEVRNEEKDAFFPFDQVKNQFAHFRGLHKLRFFYLEFSFLQLFFEVI